jgi:hypothetical protein
MAAIDDMALLKGDLASKKILFNQLIDKVISGEPLEDYQVPMLEYLKTLFGGE